MFFQVITIFFFVIFMQNINYYLAFNYLQIIHMNKLFDSSIEKEKDILYKMIRIYCRGNHNIRKDNKIGRAHV